MQNDTLDRVNTFSEFLNIKFFEVQANEIRLRYVKLHNVKFYMCSSKTTCKIELFEKSRNSNTYVLPCSIDVYKFTEIFPFI